MSINSEASSRQCVEDSKKPQQTKLRFDLILFGLTLTAALWYGSNSIISETGTISFCTSSFYGDKILNGSEFEYIVIGAGAAGSAAAARLALAGRRVLLVEAGGDTGFLTQIPGVIFSFVGSGIDYKYDTLSNNKSCLSLKDRACRFSRGKCLGGSTTINFSLYIRGNKEDYNFNVPGWTWKDIEPYFLRYEAFTDVKLLPKSSESYHNTSGIVPIGYFGDSENLWHSKIFEAFKSLNIPHNLDINGESQIGVSKTTGFISGGERISTAKAYLYREDVISALTIAKNTKCTGIVIDDDNVARGVMISQGDKKLMIYSKQEILLSAGAIGTPQLLMLSGVGPRLELEKLGIRVKADLPVGCDLTDHVMPMVFIKVDDDNSAALTNKFMHIVQWLAARSGPMASVGLTDVTAFVNTKCYDFDRKLLANNSDECEIPSLQFIFSYMEKGLTQLTNSLYRTITRLSDDVTEQIINANNEGSLIVALPVILRPKSRGWIRLASSNPSDPPLIMPNFLSEDQDVEEIERGIKIVEDMIQTPPYVARNATLLRLRLPGCLESSEDYWACYVRHMSQSVHHAVGVAAIGRVLDERLNVRGIRGLRVADASVFPHLPRGNTAAGVIALGERVSDLMLEDRGFKTYISSYSEAYRRQAGKNKS